NMKKQVLFIILFVLGSNRYTSAQIFQKAIGGTLDDQGFSVQQTTDHGFIIAGTTNNFGAGGSDYYLVKTDSSGDTLWTRTFGGTGYEYVQSVQQTTDGGYIVGGFSSSFGGSKIYLVKTGAT